MKTAIILHGILDSKEEHLDPKSQSPSNSHWLPWVQHQLLLRGVLAQALELPEPYEPSYEKWKAVFEQLTVNEETLLIGHSCGAGFLLRWLGENDVRVGKVALVAPWTDPGHTLPSDMFANFEIIDIANRSPAIGLFVSADDDKDVLDTVEQLKKVVTGMHIREFADRGHFTLKDMGTEAFPELLDFLLE